MYSLNPVPFEKVVFFPAATVRAPQTAGKQHSHAHRDQDGEHVAVHSKPMRQVAHRVITITRVDR